MMFGSKSLLRHLARGVVGLGSFALAATFANVSVLVPLILFPVGLLALGGCPMCWLLGLQETIAAKTTGSSSRRVCADGTCELTPEAPFEQGTRFLGRMVGED